MIKQILFLGFVLLVIAGICGAIGAVIGFGLLMLTGWGYCPMIGAFFGVTAGCALFRKLFGIVHIQ